MINASNPTTPEAALVTAIIMQAYRDLFMNVELTNNAFTTRSDQDQAITFLTDRTGTMARHRNAFCSFIGLDGDVMAARVRSMMDGEDFPSPTPNPTHSIMARHTAAVERLRQRWEDLKEPRCKLKRPQRLVGNLIAAE